MNRTLGPSGYAQAQVAQKLLFHSQLPVSLLGSLALSLMPPFVLLKLFSVPAKWSPAFSSKVQTLAWRTALHLVFLPPSQAPHPCVGATNEGGMAPGGDRKVSPMAISATAHEMHEPVQWVYFPRSPRMELCSPHSNDMDGNHDHEALPGVGH